jgi:DNA-directed RNA polymerase subunit RPC12/RpoP
MKMTTYLCSKCGESIEQPSKITKSSRIEHNENGETIIVFEEFVLCKECSTKAKRANPNIRVWKKR